MALKISVSIAIVVLIMAILNPSYKSFQEYTTDYKNKERVVILKRVRNLLVFSIYEKQVLDLSNGIDNPKTQEDEVYLGIVLNFFDITKQKNQPIASVINNTPVIDTGRSEDYADTTKTIHTTVSIKERNPFDKLPKEKKEENPFDNIPDSVIFGNNSCNPNKTKKDFISYMKEYYPNWKVAGNPTINDKKGHIYEVKFTALNPHDGYKKELIVAEIEYDDKGEKYGFSTIKGNLY